LQVPVPDSILVSLGVENQNQLHFMEVNGTTRISSIT